MTKKSIKQIAIFLLFFILSINPLFCKEDKNFNTPLIRIRASVDRSVVRIGDKITYRVTLESKEDIEVETPQYPFQDFSEFVLKDFGSSQKKLWGREIFKYWYILRPYKSGKYTLPPLSVKYRVKGLDNYYKAESNEVKIEVKSILSTLPNQNTILDIRGPKSFTNKLWLYLFILSILLIFIFIYYIFHKDKKRGKETEVYLQPPHIIAYKALEDLEKKNYLSKCEIEAYYTELCDILRHYIEGRFNIHAPWMTTEEFFSSLQEDNVLLKEYRDILKDFFNTTDLVKFAKHKPLNEEAVNSFIKVKELIEKTKEI
ncbi:MAG: BatD family protein [Candidatus Omnitrophica bacterium]|nr:BatD family protein [Candidatus Omnitrophota bacterium]